MEVIAHIPRFVNYYIKFLFQTLEILGNDLNNEYEPETIWQNIKNKMEKYALMKKLGILNKNE